MVENLKRMQTKDVEAPHKIHDDPIDDMIEALVTNTMPTNTKGCQARVHDPKE